MSDNVTISKVFIDEGKPEQVLISEGSLSKGYAECIAGRWDEGRRMIIEHLADMYTVRLHERSTSDYVKQICFERGIAYQDEKQKQEMDIVLEAASRRFDELHAPVFRNIIKLGYQSVWSGYPITMTKVQHRYFVRDGKNRCSILAALGAKQIPNVEVD